MTYRTFVHTMNSWLEGFMSLPRTDLRGFRVDEMIHDGDDVTTPLGIRVVSPDAIASALFPDAPEEAA